MKFRLPEKRIFIVGIFVFVFFLFCGKFIFLSQNLVLAQSQSTPTPISPTVISPQTILEDNDIEISILKTQLEDIKEYNKNLLSTVQWSIGIVVTMLVVFLGFNWFTTYRQYQKEIDEYKKELVRTISDDTNKFQATLTSTVNQNFDNLRTKDEELISNKFSSITNELNKIKIAQLESEANYWEMTGVYINAIKSYVRMIDVDPNHSTVEHTLSCLANSITHCQRKLDWLTIQNVEDAMNKTISHQKLLTEQVLTKVKENEAK